ncbi:hypothetical protein CEXT_156321 [Caerostris extrusa]|uniref:Uncharacterized protein n=1 Tax=Caerostris extrusa TaxID=172846 RepID=A0AAV4UVC9_CAEEX|nr:hypothetical protein CEXT_156321 [Caerostris extrusa]
MPLLLHFSNSVEVFQNTGENFRSQRQTNRNSCEEQNHKLIRCVSSFWKGDNKTETKRFSPPENKLGIFSTGSNVYFLKNTGIDYVSHCCPPYCRKRCQRCCKGAFLNLICRRF